MSNKPIKPSTELSRRITAEILEKIKHYETRMAPRLARWVLQAELYCGKTATQYENTKNSPNSAELFKAIRAIRNMMMRMMLGQKPSFELECMDVLGYDDPNKLLKAEHYITNQLELSRYEKGMARAIDQLLLYGSVAVHEQYEPLRQSFLGQKQYITSFRPVSLINCAFSLDAYDIEESGWVALSDIQSKSELAKLLEYDEEGKVYDTAKIKAAQAQSEYIPHVNTWVTQRMAWQGYVNQNFTGGMERVTYYGPLDCMHSGDEFCVEIINREFIIRMEEYEGIRPVRVATVDTLDVEPLGNGMADKFGPLLGKIDDSDCSLLNMVTLAGANMYTKQKSLTDEDMEFTVRQMGIMSLENPLLNPVRPDPANLAAVAGYREANIQAFRQASGATDTLQAIVSGDQATATSVSLAMNESVRNISVATQLIAPVLHKDHIRVVLQNAQKYNTEPFVLHINGAPVTVLPSDLLIDVNVRIKVVTDQDFRPAKLQRLREGIQLMAMFPPGTIPGKKMNPGPALEEYFKTLDVPRYRESIQDLGEQDLMAMAVQAQLNNPQMPENGERKEAENGAERVENGKPGKRETRILNRNNNIPMAEKDTIKTPVGNVLAAPGDEQSSTRAVRQASVTGEN